MSVPAQLLELGVKVLDVDLVQIMMQALVDNYNFFMQQTLAKLSFLASNTYKLPFCLKESRRQTRKGIQELLESFYFHHSTPLNKRPTLIPLHGINTMPLVKTTSWC